MEVLDIIFNSLTMGRVVYIIGMSLVSGNVLYVAMIWDRISGTGATICVDMSFKLFCLEIVNLKC